MAFDPCREWLGIDAIDLADPWRVLGLTAGSGNAEVIARAATARLEALARIEPGPFAKAHAALVAKVEDARDSLVARVLLDAGHSEPVVPPPPLTVDPTAGDAGVTSLPAPPPSMAMDSPTFAPADVRVANHVARRRSRPAPAAKNAGGGLLLGSLALLAAAAVLMLALMLGPDSFRRQVTVFNQATIPLEPGASPSVRKPASTATTTNRPPVPLDRMPPPVSDLARSAPALVPTTSVTEQEARPRMAESQMAESQARRDSELGEQQGTGGTPPAGTQRGQELDAAEAKRRAEQERIRMQGSLDTSIGEAYAALQRGEFDTADRAIAAAVNQVGDDVAAATRLERWRLFVTYAREFIGYRDQAFAAAQAGRDYTIDGKTFALIEITPEMFIYRLAGRNERVPRERLNPRIELAVVEKWFAADGRPANHLFLGARWLCLDPPNLSRARAEWRIAGDGGEEVAPLLALIDDPVIRRAARGAAP
jgi:hypothetical protein